jgi:Ca2+:H+ antiporter
VVSPLLVLGTSMLLGGLKNGVQAYSTERAGINSSMLGIVAATLTLPTIFYSTTTSLSSATTLSIEVAVIMLMLYILYFIFFYRSPEQDLRRPWQTGARATQLSSTASVSLLVATTFATGFVADIFVNTIDDLGIPEAFVGFILVPMVGNVAEHIVCVRYAYRNDMDSSINDSLDSSLRVALVITPVLIFAGPLVGHPFRLVFSPLALGSLVATAVILALVTYEGKCTWLKGAMLCGVYTVSALAYYFVSY